MTEQNVTSMAEAQAPEPSERPAPFVPLDVDLRDFRYMKLYGDDMLESDTWWESSHEEKVVALTSWWRSWHQVPAGSLPNDEVRLARMLGYGTVDQFRPIRERGLRGWTECSDGRLYHKVVCRIVLEAWNKKRLHAWGKEKERIRKRNKGRPAHDQIPEPPEPESVHLRLPIKLGEGSAGIPAERSGFPAEKSGVPMEESGFPADFRRTSPESPAENALKGEGEGEGEGEGKRKSAAALTPSAIVEAFDETRARLFGEARRRTRPYRSDLATAKRWIDAGADAALCQEVFARLCGARQAAGAEPPGSLNFFDGAVMEALQRRAAQPAQPADLERERWRRRFRQFFANGLWLSNWGRRPGDEGSREQALYPREMLAEFSAELEAIRENRPAS
jgi:hypothetical protein